MFTPGVSTAVGSRDPRLDSQPPMPSTPEEEVLTMGGNIQNSFFNLDHPALVVEPPVEGRFPGSRITTRTSGAPPFARMELGPAARGNVLLNQLGMRKGIR